MIHSRKNAIILAASFLAIIVLVFATVLSISANEKVDDMKEIREAFDEKYKIGESYLLEDDGYIGIEVELTTYYDYKTFGAAEPVLSGTNVALYFVNTNTERVGRETDVNIISDLLSRGFAVVTVDYFGNSRAKSPALDWSSQEVRKHVIDGSCFSDKTVFPSGSYKDTYVLPAGYNVTPFATFWSIDEHGADGTFDRIVDVWNNDFRGVKGSVVVNWTRTEIGANDEEILVQKPTQKGLDGTEPQWYSDAAGKNPVEKNSPDAKYIKIKHTLAQSITDCTAADGSPMSLDLNMHIVYPVNPKEAVPVMMQSGSSEYLTTGKTGEDTRPQHNGYLFRGYAGVIYDHVYVPMAHNQYYGYFDGSKDGSVTGDHASYTLHFLNNTKFDTAAVRYVRYLALTEPEKYGFDIENIGVYGNSKGGMFMFLGSEELREYTTVRDGMTLAESIDARINEYATNRYAIGHHGETRYQNGLTDDYTVGDYTVRGGKLQPWTTYVDADGVEREILSYVSYMYVANGSNISSMKEGHAPIFNAMCISDPLGNGYASSNQIVAAAKTLDVPCMSFVIDIEHTFAYGKDMYHNVDTYDAMFDFSDYYLKDAAVKVIYTDPAVSYADMDTSEPITIKFSGAVSKYEMAKITLCDSKGNAVEGIIWESSFGNTEWKLIHAGLMGGEEYTLTIPEGFTGENGTPIAEEFTASYRTGGEEALAPTVVTTESGTYVTVGKADLCASSGAKLRFFVENDAANTVSITEVVSYDASNPDASVLGSKVATVNIYGIGVYECDISDAMSGLSDGENKTFLLKTEKSSGIYDISSRNFGSSISKLGNAQFTRAELSTAPDGYNTAAAKVHITSNTRADGTSNYVNSYYYPSFYTVLSNSIVSKITESDLGRKYTVTLRVFDTVSREINLKLNGATNATHQILDFDYTYFTVKTTANKWSEISFEYTVLDPLYGSTALSAKTLTVSLAGDGDKESPIYISELTVKENVTDVSISNVGVALYNDGTSYKAPVSDKPFTIGQTSYDSLSKALSAAKSGDTVVLNANCTVTESFDGLENLSSLTIDLSGYKLYVKDSLFCAKATSSAQSTTHITVKNGAVYIGDSALVNYSGSTSSGTGKTFSFDFENVKFIATDLAMAKKLISESKVSSVKDLTVLFNFDGCDFIIEKQKLTRNPVTLFAGGSGELEISYTLNGGKIVLDTASWVTLWDFYRDVTVLGDRSNHTVINIPAVMPIGDVSVKGETTVFYYASAGENSGISTYKTVEYEHTTPYGIIPNECAEVTKYPFVAFDKDGNFLGGFSYFNGSNGSGSVLEKARAFLADNGYNNGEFDDPDATVYIVARRHYELGSGEYFNNIAQIQGTVVIDLQGKTLSQGTCSAAFFKLTSKSWSNAAGEKVFPVTINVINGTFKVAKTGVMSLNSYDSAGTGAILNKEINLTFNGVTFAFDSAASASNLIATYDKATGTSAAKYGIELNDCVFDLATVPPSSALTLFDTDTQGKYIDIDYTVNGGLIRGGAFNNITIANSVGSHGSSAVFGIGADGEYTKLNVNKDVNVAIGSYVTASGSVLGYTFEKSTDSGDVYKLSDNDLVTKYGTIPEECADADEYPFAIFDGNGNFVSASGKWLGTDGKNSALSAVYSYLSKNTWDATKGEYTFEGGEARTAVIYLRRNYTMSSANDNKFNNFGYIMGEFTVDLGGHTLSQGDGGYVFPLEAKGSTPNVLNVKNGTVLTNSKRIIQVYSTSAGSAKDVRVTFDGVTFGFAKKSTISALFFSVGTASGNTKVCNFYVTFNDCIFDFENACSSNEGFTVFPKTGSYCKVVTTVNGGEFRFGSNTNITISTDDYAYESCNIFAKGTDGNYPTLTFSGETVTAESLTTQNGEMKFVKMSDGKYILASVANPYGEDIPQEYGYAEKYPFIVLDQNGSFLAAYDTLYGSNSGMAGKICYTHLNDGSTTGCIVLMRRDYTLGTGEYFNNWAAANGTVIFDLCGYSINQQSGSRSDALFKLTGKKADGKVFPTTITVKNGSINMYLSTVVSMDCYGTDPALVNKLFTFTFDNVKFGLTTGATLSTLLINAKTTDNGAYAVPFVITYNGCEFDLVTNSNGKVIKLFNNNATAAKYVSCTVNVNGGVIKALSADLVDFWNLSDPDNSSVIFGKGSGGYIKLILPKGAPAPETAFPTANGSYVFAKTADDGESTVYEFEAYKPESVEFVPKMSLTLDRDLVLNVYVPAKDFLLGFTIDGKESGEYDLEEVIIENEKYYRISIPLNSSEACRNVVLKAKISVGEKTATGTFTFNVIKYAEKVLAGDFELEKVLVRDVLSYVRAAYVYFGSKDADCISKLNAILGEDYDEKNMPEMNGSAEATLNGLQSATLVLDATPSIRFILDSKIDAGRYEFFINGVKVKTEVSADGKYVDIDAYAYALCETVTYTIDGVEMGSYHINAYYEWSKGQSKENLENLVARFAKYCESAAEYRRYVTAG